MKRNPPVLRTLAIEFLQSFVNQMVKAGLAKALINENTFMLPNNVLAIEPYFLWEGSSAADIQAFEVHGISWTLNGHVRLTDVIGQGPEAEVVRATWRAVFVHGHGSGQCTLSSPSIDFCSLGDFVIFCFAELPLFMESRLLGVCACIIGQFGKWLDTAIHVIAPPTKTLNIPKLQGLIRARGLDTMQLGHLAKAMAEGQLANQAQAGQDFGHMKRQYQALVYLYVNSLAKRLATSPSQSLHVMADGWRSVGEAMDLFFVYSPLLKLGGWLPFQVP